MAPPNIDIYLHGHITSDSERHRTLFKMVNNFKIKMKHNSCAQVIRYWWIGVNAVGQVHCKVCNCPRQSLLTCGFALCASGDISVSLRVIQRWRRSSAECKNNTFISLLPSMFPTTESCCRCFYSICCLVLLARCFTLFFHSEQMWFCPTAHVPSRLWFFLKILPPQLFYSVQSSLHQVL